MSIPPTDEIIKTGTLVIANELATPLPLEHTQVSAQVIGPLASVRVAQRFRNPLTEQAEFVYLFPLPHEAALIDFELHIGTRRVSAELQELEQARQAYETARQQGQYAGLLEQRRPNLFAVQLANIAPGETLLACLSYQQNLEFRAGEYEFVFPMGLTPRYHSPGHPDEAQGVDAPLTQKLSEVGPVEIELAIQTTAELPNPTSPSHPLRIHRLSPHAATITLDGLHLPVKDFVLRYPSGGAQTCLSAFVTASPLASVPTSPPPPASDYFLATLLPPVQEAPEPPQPREMIFVLDRSGSMSGEPLLQAINALRACLRGLNAQDTFYILAFDDQLEWFSPTASQVTQAAIEQADRYLQSVKGRGGTEILGAIQASLSLPPDQRRARYVVFLTDGAASAETRALKQVRALLGAARLFTFGIGPSVNRALLQQLARVGGGTAEFLGLDEDIEGAILRFQDRIAYPLLGELKLHAENCHIWDVYPTRLPDLFSGQPITICGRLKRFEKGLPRLVLTGQRSRHTITVQTELNPVTAEASLAAGCLPHFWAQARLAELLEQMALQPSTASRLRAEAISLALEHRLASPYTAFVAVDIETASPGQPPRRVHVAQPLPEGLDLDGFIGRSAPLQALSLAPVPGMAGYRQSTIYEDNLDLPAFVRARPSHRRVTDYLGSARKAPSSATPDNLTDESPEATLRRLARSQKLNGSWDEDVELTAAALLALVRNGHTTRQGYLRKTVQRACQWLERNLASGFAAYLRALAFNELAAATQVKQQLEAARQAQEALPAPQTPAEKAAWALLQGQPWNAITPNQIDQMDDLRLLAACHAQRVNVAPNLWVTEPGLLLDTYLACLI